MTGQSQDIDSRTGETINHGEPVKHDMLDGQSTGHSVEPEGKQPPAQPAEEPSPTPPPRTTRDEIYEKARALKQEEISDGQQSMSEEDRAHYDRMNAELRGEDWSGQTPPAPTDTPEQAQVAQQQAAQAEPARQDPPQSTDPALAPEQDTVTIIVYGMREEVPRADVEAAGGIDAYQKNRAADEKLRRLTTYEASLRDWDSQLAEQADRVRRSPPARASAGSEDPSPTDDPNSAENLRDLASEVADGFYSGDRDEAVEKLTAAFERVQARSTGATRPTSPEPPAAQPEYQPAPAPQQQGPTQQDMDRANAVFASEFGDLNTPVLRSAVLAMVGEVQREPLMRGRPLDEVTREAAMRVKADVMGVRPPQPGNDPVRSQTVPTDLGERMHLKSRTVVNPLHQAAQRAPSGEPDEPQYPSNSEYVQQMRERRNQPRTG